MRNKARKFTRSAPLVAALAIIGALTLAGVLLLPNADNAEAQAAPSAPDNFRATPGNGEATLSWSAPSDDGGANIEDYDVQQAMGASAPTSDAGWTDRTGETEADTERFVTITPLTNGTKYWFRVRAGHAGGEGAWTAPMMATPSPVAPGAPTDPTATQVADDNDALTIAWTAPTEDGGSTITGYQVRYRFTDVDAVTADAQPGPWMSPMSIVEGDANLTGLRSGTAYEVQVRAVNSVDPGAWSDTATSAETDGTAPSSGKLTADTETGGASVKFTLAITLTETLSGSSWVELYLEDDYVEPSSINRQTVVFEARTTDDPAPTDEPNPTFNTTFASAAVEIDDGGKIGDEGDAVVISARIPDMRVGDELGYPQTDQMLFMVVTSAAGVKNPTEAGSHSAGFSVLGGTEDRAKTAEMKLADLMTVAKISLSDEDGGRGDEITITGSGFNNGTTAEAFVLVKATGGKPSCEDVVTMGDSLGSAVVGSDDKFSISFTVHQDEFDRGMVNYICAKDGEPGDNRHASAVKSFDMTDSLSVSPAEVSAGDEVTVKPREFPMATTAAPAKVILNDGGNDIVVMGADLKMDGSNYLFDMPGNLSGPVNLRFERGGENASAKIAVVPATLGLSKTEVAPNESIVITGDGFSEGSYIKVMDIKIDGQPLAVDESGTETMNGMEVVKITSAGTFSATVRVWSDGDDNPALDDGTYKIKVKDAKGFTGSASITILAPTLMVHPAIAGPRDYIKISGANWPVSTSDADHDVTITINEGAGQKRERSTGIDSTGRFHYEYQLRSTVQLGKDHTITVEYKPEKGGDIEEEITFTVPSSNVTITPEMARPGDTVTLELTGMPIIELVDEVIIDGSNRLHNVAYTTDSNGDVTVEVVVPYADAGFYPVRIVVENVTAIVQLEILGETTARGAASPLPAALAELGDNLSAVFYFDNSTKSWTFFDPRPEFAELNTLTEVAENNSYWILVKETQEGVVLNGQTRTLSCVGGNCWNPMIW